VNEAADRFLTDRESAGLGAAQLGKYKHVVSELKASIGSIPPRNVTVDDIRRIKEGWKLSPITVQKRLERVRKFFAFCVNSEWLERNPAKQVKLPPAKYDPTMPFTDEEMEKVLCAAEFIREAHPKIPAKLVALIHSPLKLPKKCLRSASNTHAVFPSAIVL
jgi:site-specific recombinase XerD